MNYNFLNSSLDIKNISLPGSDKINPFLLKNNQAEIIKGIDFFATEEILLHIHGFLGTGKRQFINYISEFLNSDVIKLEYYCKASTVCDDILLSFIDLIEKNPISKAVNLNTKISTLAFKFQHYIASIKKPFVIILHSYDDVLNENTKIISDCFEKLAQNSNIKIVVSTRSMLQNLFVDVKTDRKIFLKALSKEIFKEYLESNKITSTNTTLEDFYKYTRGYYYYTALSIKIIQAMKVSLNEFLEKFTLSGMNFDSYLGAAYINLIPSTIRNFFWFLRCIRHGLTLNALAIFELYDEFSIEYLKSNLMIFQSEETVYVQDYFQQDIDISIPSKTEIKLHKYIISIYEKQLKEPLQTREILISRQALRAEIEYHSKCIKEIETGNIQKQKTPDLEIKEEKIEVPQIKDDSIEIRLDKAKKLAEEKQNTLAIEEYKKLLDTTGIDLGTVTEIRIALARLFKEINDYHSSQHYYEIVETYYRQKNEVINLNYLLYELTNLYFLMYKNDRAIDTIKKVIYSVDTPQSLMVASCTLLGNIYSSMNIPDEAYNYYKKALDSLDANTSNEVLSELYFKYALANDDRNDKKTALEYYSKCITQETTSPYRVLAYSNMGSCYFENENYSDAKDCFQKAYDIDKSNNNYEGIYYNSSKLAEIYIKEKNKKALDFLLEAKLSAEFINEPFYILESEIALGDYYYNNISLNKKALIEYFNARKIAEQMEGSIDVKMIEHRIKDMKLRMDKEIFEEIEKKHG